MSLQGPIVIVAETSSVELAEAIKLRGNAPIVETTWDQAAEAIRTAWPAGVIINERPPPEKGEAVADISAALDILQEAYLPVLARVGADGGPTFAHALPISSRATPARILAQLASAQRVRALDVTVAQRTATLQADGGAVPEPVQGDPLEDAAVLVTGRGRSYPELCTAVGERLAMIGSLSVETAARHLTSRPLDGIFIGPGFGPATVNAFLTALSEDARFRNLPIALIGGVPVTVDCSNLPNFERFDAGPATVLKWMLPLIRLHAYAARQQRQLAAIEAKGLLDPSTGLFNSDAFAAEFQRALDTAREERRPLSLARFWFPAGTDPRVVLDAARLASRLIRSIDFAARAPDGSLLLAFPNTSLRGAHVVARRMATTLKNTVITPEPAGRIETSLALATLTPSDTTDTLLARVFDTVCIPEEAAE